MIYKFLEKIAIKKFGKYLQRKQQLEGYIRNINSKLAEYAKQNPYLDNIIHYTITRNEHEKELNELNVRK